ncbi:hypothetical protein ACNSOP_07360 [Aliarcobacter lanthieri]|uniref:hypothetical protein n=1 Tax=Aliarcobacter lanthieri TaxID=1355374 RepID=UPI003AAE420D
MPILLPLATALTAILTVKTVKKSIKTYERRKKDMKEIKFDLEVQKEVAKIGMTATLGATVVTSMFMKNSIAKKLMLLQELPSVDLLYGITCFINQKNLIKNQRNYKIFYQKNL